MNINQTISNFAASNPYIGVKLANANTASMLLASTIGASTTTPADSSLQNLLSSINAPATAALPSSVAAAVGASTPAAGTTTPAAGTTTPAAFDDPNQNPALAVANTQSNVATALLAGEDNLGTLLDTTA
jgi:hypothetical protein